MADVRITITAKDGTQQVFKAVENGVKSATDNIGNAVENSSSRTKSAFEGIKASWVAITAAITAAVATVVTAIKSLIDQAALAARVETLGVVLTVVGRNAGYSAREMQGYAEGVRRMGITTQESLSSVTPHGSGPHGPHQGLPTRPHRTGLGGNRKHQLFSGPGYNGAGYPVGRSGSTQRHRDKCQFRAEL